MLIRVFDEGSLFMDSLARVSEPSNMFARAVTHATDLFRLFRQY